MPASTDLKLPQDGWIALHQDGTICLSWDMAGLQGAGVVPLLRFREAVPRVAAECTESGESLDWTRCSVMVPNAAARLGGIVRMIDDE